MANIFKRDVNKIAYKIKLHLIAIWKADKYRYKRLAHSGNTRVSELSVSPIKE